MIITIALLIIAGIFCIYKVIKELRKGITIDLTQEDYGEY
jgi:uncharacterized membrane protein YqjE